jgi:iron uptake system EfeUOB component EfeO/EfeM
VNSGLRNARRSARAVAAGVVLAAMVLAAAGCGGDDSSSTPSGTGGKAGVRTVAVTLTADGCEPKALQVPAGPATFHVTNGGSAAATEFEVLENGKILAEVENVAPGIERSFSMTLKPGSYATKCTGDDKQNGTLEVTAAPAGS